MALSKQAKVLSKTQVNVLLHYVSQKRQPIRNRVIVLLSVKAGLRAKEIAHLQWSNVLNAESEIAGVLEITDKVSKGSSGRVIPLNKELKKSLASLLKRVSELLCMSNLVHASKLKEHDDNDDFQGTTGRTA